LKTTDHNTSLSTGNSSAGTNTANIFFYCFFIFIYWFIMPGVFAQEQKIADSLAIVYQQTTQPDSVKLELLTELSFNEIRDLKKAVNYTEELISLAEQSNNIKYLRAGYFIKGTKARLLGNLDEALAAFFKSAEVAKKYNLLTGEGDTYSAIADIYSDGNNHSNATNYYNKAIQILRVTNDSINLASALLNAGDEFRKIKNYDSALLFFKEAKLIFDKANHLIGQAYSLGNIGMVYAGLGRNDLAETNMNEAIRILAQSENYDPICDYLTSIADVYLNRGNNQAALNYTLRSLRLAEQYGLKEKVAKASLQLSALYEKAGSIQEAFNYYKKHIAYRDSISNINSVQKMADLRTNYEVSQKQIEVNLLNQQKQNQKNLVVSLAIILGLTLVILGVLLKYNQNKQRAYKILNLQKQATDEQKSKAENALTKLQAAQKQLIHSAKMASLGEVTAGIAHEIQNPLNFVNNFSEVSVELLDELKEGSFNKLTPSDKASAHGIINDLVNNLKKISDHGKRADSIVKGMLQHSRGSTGKKEPINLNALAEECLRLSYHGLRAKDKTFNANFKTDFDKSLPDGKEGNENIEVVPQDMARVLLNLCNNAFYSVNLKKKHGDSTFEPLVSVTTKRIGDKAALSVKDNGMGIPQEVLDKIFQPFFTTKPSGHGTGLGLSLSYDIVKAQGGEFKVESKEGDFAEFTVLLPLSKNNEA
jgi:two-component system, NtrC family, sensor kinase